MHDQNNKETLSSLREQKLNIETEFQSLIQKHKMIEEEINAQIKSSGADTNKISDGYHTFEELYEHRIELYIALCRKLDESGKRKIWKSKTHSDGTSYPSWFILGINIKKGEQISYHLPLYKWSETDFAFELEKAPEFDGHSAKDVLKRISEI